MKRHAVVSFKFASAALLLPIIVVMNLSFLEFGNSILGWLLMPKAYGAQIVEQLAERLAGAPPRADEPWFWLATLTIEFGGYWALGFIVLIIHGYWRSRKEEAFNSSTNGA